MIKMIAFLFWWLLTVLLLFIGVLCTFTWARLMSEGRLGIGFVFFIILATIITALFRLGMILSQYF